MKILTSSQFVKNYKKRIKPNPRLKNRFQERIKLFEQDKTNPILRDHQLKGNKMSFRSFSITGDIRVIYSQQNENAILLIDIGTHAQVYKL